eukprot:TRINITY_DN2135_c2_g1_i2.p1 TRINITY_DN2135_c2_g1~~TRINITY_DN2135_c2_g1_i2.p1  ORF type:complete len:598 (-),score=246.37 TRINITY_DN2135_c2_g1_i2:135-1928(-)
MAEETIQINIKTLDNKTVPIVTKTNILVSDFKKRIESEMKVPIQSQRLIYQGKVLKDNLFLKDYSMKDSSTLHMISRPDNQPNNTNNPSSLPSNSNSSPAPPQSSNPNENIPQPHNLLMGSISIPENASMPQFSHLLGEVFNSLGIRGTPNISNQPIPHHPPPQSSNEDGFVRLRHLLSNLSQSISLLPSSVLPSSSIASSTLSSDPTSSTSSSTVSTSAVENAGICLGQLANSFEQIHPALSTLSNLLKNESSITSNNRNNNNNNNNNSNGNGTVSPSSFSREQVEGLSAQMSTLLEQMSSISSLLSNCLSTIRMGETPGRGQAIPPSTSIRNHFVGDSIPQGAIQVSMPLFTVNPRAGIQIPAQAPNSVPTNATSNILNHIASIINGGAPSPQAPSSTSMAAPPTPSATNVEQGDQSLMNDPNRSNTAAVLMSQTFNAVNQAMHNPYPSSVSSVIGSIAQGFSDLDHGNEEESALDLILKIILDYMTLPEMLSVMSGNWTPVERLHPVLKEFILNEMLKKDSSPSNLERLAEDISGSLKGSLHPSALPEDVRKRIRPGFDIAQLVHQVVKRHVLKLLQLILSTLPVSQSNPRATR